MQVTVDVYSISKSPCGLCRSTANNYRQLAASDSESSHTCQVTAGTQRYVSQLVTWEASEVICL